MGQTDRQVKFLSRGSGYTLFLTHGGEAMLALSRPLQTQPGIDQLPSTPARRIRPTVLRMDMVGANEESQGTGLEPLPGKVNYFIGNDAKEWHTGIATYAKVKYEAVYPGVDLIYYGNQGQLEFDFIVAPGTDPQIISVAFEGAERVELDDLGHLVLHAAGQEIRLLKPVIYQHGDDGRQEIKGSYVLKGRGQVGFEVAGYDASKSLIIDPLLAYSTFLGGSGSEFDQGLGVAVDSAGNAYVTGETEAADFPTSMGALQTVSGGQRDAFVTKLNPAGTALVYSTY